MSHESNMARNTRKTIDEVREGAQDIKDAVQERAGNIVQSVHKTAADATAAVKEHYENVRDTASDYYEQGRKRAKKFEKSLEHRVHDRPLMALLTALGAGFLIGFLFRRS